MSFDIPRVWMSFDIPRVWTPFGVPRDLMIYRIRGFSLVWGVFNPDDPFVSGLQSPPTTETPQNLLEIYCPQPQKTNHLTLTQPIIIANNHQKLVENQKKQ